MKRFFQQILLFAVIVVALASVFATVNLRLIRDRITCPANFRLPDTTRILIIGDSYVGLSLNPEYIPGAVNETVLGEHYVYSYARLRYFLDNNPQIERVVLSFNYSTLAAEFDRSLLETRNKAHFFSTEFMLLGDDEINLLRSNDLVFLRNFLAWKAGVPSRENMSLIAKTFRSDFKPQQMPFRGCYINGGNVSYMSDYHVNLRIRECFNLDMPPESAPLIVEYLHKIIALCDERGVRLTLFASPLSDKFFDAIPEFYRENFRQTCRQLPPQVQLIDYSRVAMPDSCFEDVNHLNAIGAKAISERFREEIK